MKQPATALLVMDMQLSILSTLPDDTAIVKRVAQAIAAARKEGIPVIYVIAGFRKYAPEINANNKFFQAHREKYEKADPEQLLKIHLDIQPNEDEIVVIKHRISAFSGSDLELVLKALEIKHLVLTGFATSGVILSTVREAADKDFQITVLADGCTDADEEVHRVLITKVFPMQADIMTIATWSV